LDINNILKGLNAIENRSKGLLGFVESYKNLTQIPKPNYERINILNLLNDIIKLFEDDFKFNNIEIDLSIETNDLTIIADSKLISQVIINLVKNSMYALSESKIKKISLKCFKSSLNKVCVSVRDSGKGISEDILDKIFVPFFTTRNNGSGIGLSFARQVMVMHNGSIEVQSTTNETTSFNLYF